MQNSELLGGEELRPVEGAGEKYLVSNMGRVCSTRKGGFLKLQNVNGYAFAGFTTQDSESLYLCRITAIFGYMAPAIMSQN